MKIEQIETQRLYLRQTLIEDKENIYRLLSDEEVVKNLNLTIHSSIEDTE